MITLVVDFHSSTTYLQSQKFLALVTTLKYFFQSVRKIFSGPCSLCAERVVPASRPLPRFLDTSMRHVLVVGTDNNVSPGALFVICSQAANSLWQSDWDLHTCSTALQLRSARRELKVGPQANAEELGVARPPQQQAHRHLPLSS